MSIDNLIEIIGEVTKIPSAEINDATILVDDLGMDSLEFLKVISAVQEQIDDILPNANLDAVITVADLYKLIAEGRAV